MDNRKKIGIASILALNSDLLLIDEPDLGLNLVAVKALFKLFHHLNDNGKAIICITHNLNYVYHQFPRVILLRDGRVFADGNPRKILRNCELLQNAGLDIPSLVKVTLDDDERN